MQNYCTKCGSRLVERRIKSAHHPETGGVIYKTYKVCPKYYSPILGIFRRFIWEEYKHTIIEEQ